MVEHINASGAHLVHYPAIDEDFELLCRASDIDPSEQQRDHGVKVGDDGSPLVILGLHEHCPAARSAASVARWKRARSWA